jgi:hypothetical protein
VRIRIFSRLRSTYFHFVLSLIYYIHPEEKGIIEKMADYVARNGPKFEDLLKEKQKENPKFGFLYEGSKYYDYYKFRIYAVKNNLGEVSQFFIIFLLADPL